jgi:UDP-N-acetylglucosamine 2-epimerase (non-hydrolysing)
LPAPHIHLGIGSGTHSEQTGKVMIEYEKIVMENKPNLVIVVGDVNSTIACTLAASKAVYNQTKNNRSKFNRPIIAHLEAGLRSFDRSMPEEINRIATDALADVLWTPSIDGNQNLLSESVKPEKITLVGNIMIDSLEMMRNSIEAENVASEYNINSGEYIILTLHRPANVDNPEALESFCCMINRVSEILPIIFPVHPRTRKNLEIYGLWESIVNNKNIRLLDPQNYIRFMNLIINCKAVITDSGGIQEETTYLGIPCFTLRENTERPITIEQGTNQLCTLDDIEEKIDVLQKRGPIGTTPPMYWDGKTASRVVESIKSVLYI